MKHNTLKKILAIGAITGLRSMAGVATLSFAGGGVARHLVPALALGEMVLDKTPFVGNRVDALPLAGRALLGAVSGGLIARAQRDHIVLGGLLGATSAIVAAHVAYRVRTRLPWSSVGGGLVEDGIVLALAAPYTSSFSGDRGRSVQASHVR